MIYREASDIGGFPFDSGNMAYLIDLKQMEDREITIRRGERTFTISDRIPVSAAALLLRVAEAFECEDTFDEETWNTLRELILRLFQVRYPIMTQDDLDDFLGIDGYGELASHFFEQRAPVETSD